MTGTATPKFAVSCLVPARSPDLSTDWGQCPLLAQSGHGGPPLGYGTACSANPSALVNAGELFRWVN
jgi:hypothetical protein